MNLFRLLFPQRSGSVRNVSKTTTPCESESISQITPPSAPSASTNVIDIGQAREDQDERETCRLWDEFLNAAQDAHLWRDYESLVLVLKAISKVKIRIITRGP